MSDGAEGAQSQDEADIKSANQQEAQAGLDE